MSAKLRALVVDDEPLARRGLQLRLAAHGDVEVVGECRNGEEALAAVAEVNPDLMFLDVQMPGLDGFATLRRMPAANMPAVVFVTAYDHYAVQAFEASAIDYLLKPIEDARLAQALARVRRELSEREAELHCARLLRLVGELSGQPALTLEQALAREGRVARPPDGRIAFKDGPRIVRVLPSEIRWIDAAGDYMCVHTDAATHVVRATLRELEQQLDPRVFTRIHRSTMVNLRRVVELRAHINGEFFLKLDCGNELKLSRSYKDRVDLLRG